MYRKWIFSVSGWSRVYTPDGEQDRIKCRVRKLCSHRILHIIYTGKLQMASQVPITVRVQPPAASVAALRGKKRSGSPAVAVAPQNPAASSKKKKQPTVAPTAQAQVTKTQLKISL